MHEIDTPNFFDNLDNLISPNVFNIHNPHVDSNLKGIFAGLNVSKVLLLEPLSFFDAFFALVHTEELLTIPTEKIYH